MIVKPIVAVATLLGGALGCSACASDAQALTPQSIEQQYGLSGAYADSVATSDGPVTGTTVPATLADGRTVQLFIPTRQSTQPHSVYVRDSDGLHPVHLRDRATRDEITQSPAIVEKQPEPAHGNKRSWEKEALIIGGGAGAGAVVGAVSGGKKGASIGAAAGGVGGLIYDLVTRDKK